MHCWATDKDDATVMPRWGKIGKQKIVDEGPLRSVHGHGQRRQTCMPISDKHKYDMDTFDEVLVKSSTDFMDKAKKDGKPFFLWHNTTRMHVWTFLSKKYKAMMNSKTNYGLEEAGMAQLDDSIGALMKHLDDIGEADNTILDLQHRQRRRSVHLAGRRHDAVQGHQGHRRAKAASACRASPAGRARSSRARFRTASSPASTGSRRSSPPPAIRTSPTSSSRA